MRTRYAYVQPSWPGVNTMGTFPGVEPVGTLEIAERLGVTRDAVNQWRRRGLGFPEPQWNVGGRPAWEWEDVEAWARETGRL